MSANGKRLEFSSGGTIYNENTLADHFYIIKSGEVGVFKKGKNGTKVPIAIVGANEFLGELSLAQGSNRTSSAIALTEVCAIQITKTEFDKQVKSANPWVRALLMHTIQRLQATNNVLRNNGFVDHRIHQKIEEYMSKNEILRGRVSTYSPHD